MCCQRCKRRTHRSWRNTRADRATWSCNIIAIWLYAYELTGWNAPALLEVMSLRPMVLAGSHIQPNPLFEQAAGWLSRQESVVELLSSNRDLAALSMLSATWRDRDLPSIADNLATVLAPIVNPEFIATTSLGGGREGYRLAWMQSAVWARSNVIDALRALMPGDMGDSTVSVMTNIVNPADQRTCRVLFVPLGIGANALLVIGSADPGFPTASQRILIGLSVCLLSISIQVSRDLTVQKRAERRTAQPQQESGTADNIRHQRVERCERRSAKGGGAPAPCRRSPAGASSRAVSRWPAQCHGADGRTLRRMNSASLWARSPITSIPHVGFSREGREHEPDLARMNMDHAAEVVLRAGRIIQRLREFVADGQPERHPENIADLIDDAGSSRVDRRGGIGHRCRPAHRAEAPTGTG